MAEISLARDFPLSSEADWQALVKEALKGAPLSSLGTTSYDGIAIEPLYARAKDGNVIPGREPGEAWAVMQRVDLPDAETANAQILDDLNNAARGIVLVFEGAVGDYGYALPATEAAIEAILKGVHLDWGVPIELDFGPPSRQAATARRELREGERACARLGQYPLRLRSVRRHGHAGRGAQALERARAGGDRPHLQSCVARFHWSLLRRRRETGPRGRRIGSAGACLRACQCRHLSPRARGSRHVPRGCAPLDLLPSCRRPGSVPDHRQVSGDPETLGARRRGVRA